MLAAKALKLDASASEIFFDTIEQLKQRQHHCTHKPIEEWARGLPWHTNACLQGKNLPQSRSSR